MPIPQFATFEKAANFPLAVKLKLIELITAVNSGGGGGGGITIDEATLDFGSYSTIATVSINDATVTTNTKVLLTLKNDPSRDGDELEMAPMTLGVHVKAGVGFDIYANALQGADGQFKVNYTKA